MARVVLVAAIMLVACSAVFGQNQPVTPPASPPAPRAPVAAPIAPQLPPQAPAAEQVIGTGTTNINGNTVGVSSTVLGAYTPQTFPNTTFCNSVQLATGTTGCVVNSVSQTNFAGRKFSTKAVGVVVNYQVQSATPTTVLRTLVNAANANTISGFTVTSSQAVALAVTPTQPAAAPTIAGTMAVIDWVIVGTQTSFDTTNQAAFRSAIQQALGGVSNTQVVINSIQQTTVGRKVTIQTSALRVTTSVTAPAFASSAAITQRLQDTVRTNGGRIGAFTVVSLSGQTFNTAALTRPTLAAAAAAVLFLAMLF